MDIKIDVDALAGKIFDLAVLLVILLGANFLLENGISSIFNIIVSAF